MYMSRIWFHEEFIWHCVLIHSNGISQTQTSSAIVVAIFLIALNCQMVLNLCKIACYLSAKICEFTTITWKYYRKYLLNMCRGRRFKTISVSNSLFEIDLKICRPFDCPFHLKRLFKLIETSFLHRIIEPNAHEFHIRIRCEKMRESPVRAKEKPILLLIIIILRSKRKRKHAKMTRTAEGISLSDNIVYCRRRDVLLPTSFAYVKGKYNSLHHNKILKSIFNIMHGNKHKLLQLKGKKLLVFHI